MTDIVEQLYEYADQLGKAYPQCDGEMIADAAAGVIESLRQQLAECQADDDYIKTLERNIVKLDKENFELHLAATHSERELREERKKLASCLANKWKSRGEKAEQQLAECQAREKVLLERNEYFESVSTGFEIERINELAPLPPSDSTALDTMLTQAKREGILYSYDYILKNGGLTYGLRHKAEELK